MDVKLNGLSKRFTRDNVLTHINLDLPQGQIVAIIGLNGAGKTTLFRCLANVISPTSGSITWDGSDSLRDDLERHRRMMFLPDFPLLLGEKTVIEHVAFHLHAYDRDAAVRNEDVIAMLRELSLIEYGDTRVMKLSRGQHYKTAIAALMLIQPELWLLDEPFASGMDPQGMFAFKRHAREAAAKGACIVYTTQIIEIAERFCDVLLVIDRGRIAHRFGREELRMMPGEGPGSLGERLSSFRESR